ncbi:hypothetical protein EUX98_g5707 [Antrodiella citrinella]|uniref:Fungal-type protein kinase domain-containing protein n=1 Tax=Antrodiella citrinella TaxID=2447956 RepID=A0A4S4MTK2_9APHY|nr:hypothetical protein EUX98_g5707 [Antrodiella citrinella]
MESFTTSTSGSKYSEAKLLPLSGLVDADEVYKVYYDVFRGYRRLYDQGGAEHLHRNINYADIACRRHDDGSVSGVLLDLDVSSSSSSAQRTSAPNVFKAIDLLCADPPKPLYRHDLESLFYVMVWHIHRYQDGKLVDDPPFEDWARGTLMLHPRASAASFS